MEDEAPKLLMDVDEAAALLGVGRKLIYDLAAREELPHVRIGRYVRFRRQSLLDWIEASEVPARAAREPAYR